MTPSEIVWIWRGPRAGNYMAMEPDEAAAAERDGWGQRCRDQDAARLNHPKRDDYPAAVEWLASKCRGGKCETPARRDLEAERPAPALNRQMEADTSTTYKTKATGKKRGRPPKNRGE